MARSCCSSMLTLTSFTSCSSAMRSRTGETAWHGPHHSAQKSTITPTWFSRPWVSYVAVVALVAISSFPNCCFRGVHTAKRPGWMVCSQETGTLTPPSYDRNMFDKLPDKPDHPALELELLETWEREGTFEQLRQRNADGPRWSFIDGPVTANKTMGVHTAWGRTLKDVFQRYKALRGFHQRYQNGWDCQGLWIEVGVERELGLNSKREIEEYGLEEFAAKCRDVVVWSSTELTRASKRLGQWMDWGNDYFTFSDMNIEYIWKFLKIVNERGWLYTGHPSTEWCPRCGTSLSLTILR